MGLSARRFVLSAFALVGTSLAAFPTYAQAPAASQPSKPISTSELEKFIVVGSINTCILLQDKVSFDTAMKANVSALGSLIANLHGSQVQGVNDGKPMSSQQLTQGLALQTAALAADRCPKLIPEKDLAEIKKAFGELEKLNGKSQPSR